MIDEALGKLAYEVFRNDHVDDRDPELFEWDEYSDVFKRHWIAAARAVAALYQHPLTEDRVREIVREMFEQMLEPAASRISESVKQMIESMDE